VTVDVTQLIANLAILVTMQHDAMVEGMKAAQRGIARVNAEDDRRKINDLGGPPVIPPPDQAAETLHEFGRRRKRVIDDLGWMANQVHFARLGLPREDPGRHPTAEEQSIAENENIDEDDELWCQSCIRVVTSEGVARNPRVGGSKLCGWCAEVIRKHKPGGDPDEPHWHQLGAPGAKPPVDLVRMHVEAQAGRGRKVVPRDEAIGALTRCFGAPLKEGSLP
jgi:hypothetical protein